MKIKFFKCLCIFICFLIFLAIFSGISGFTLKDSKLLLLKESLINKIKANINYYDGPNQADFFTESELSKYFKIGQNEMLKGIWTGTYDLTENSVFWTNPKLDKVDIFKLIDLRTYILFFRFDNTYKNRFPKLSVSQEDIDYGSVNIEQANDKQINYWTNAKSRNWVEIIRGKIFRLNDNELFTVFQTTVYERKIPIYAFRGEVVLRKKQ